MMTAPCSLVIFGSTGNLARNKLLPALYHLDLAQCPGRLTINPVDPKRI